MTDNVYLVNYHKAIVGREKFELFYNVPTAHKDHAPARVTMNGKILVMKNKSI